MSTKSLVCLIALITLQLSPCLGEYQTFPIWHYNASLDFGGKNVTVETRPITSDLYSTMRSILFRGSSAGDWGSIYLLDSRQPAYSVPMEDTLRSLMISSCKAVRINPGSIGNISGLIAKADARVEHGFGQTCYGGIVQLTSPGPQENTFFVVIGHFTDESLNEAFVKTANIYYTG
ncbi:MAG: hypothetical protein ACE14P_11025 [Methanotrichaceae archaeon]